MRNVTKSFASNFSWSCIFSCLMCYCGKAPPTGDFPVIGCCQHILAATCHLLFLPEQIMHFDFHKLSCFAKVHEPRISLSKRPLPRGSGSSPWFSVRRTLCIVFHLRQHYTRFSAFVKYELKLRARPTKLAEIPNFWIFLLGTFGVFEEGLRQLSFTLFAVFCFHK